MAKTIKELSVEYERAIGSQEYCYLDIEESYQAGANAVLDNIEKFADVTWGCKSLNTISLKKKIKELRDEQP